MSYRKVQPFLQPIAVYTKLQQLKYICLGIAGQKHLSNTFNVWEIQNDKVNVYKSLNIYCNQHLDFIFPSVYIKDDDTRILDSYLCNAVNMYPMFGMRLIYN